MGFCVYSRCPSETAHLSTPFHDKTSWVTISAPHLTCSITDHSGFYPHHTTEASQGPLWPSSCHIQEFLLWSYLPHLSAALTILLFCKHVFFSLLLSRIEMGFPPVSLAIPSHTSLLVPLLPNRECLECPRVQSCALPTSFAYVILPSLWL